MLIRRFMAFGLGFVALPGFAQVMPPLPDDKEFTNCKPIEPIASPTNPGAITYDSATDCFFNKPRKNPVVEGKYVFVGFSRLRYDARFNGQKVYPFSFYSARGISCSDGFPYSRSVAERLSEKGVKYVSSAWQKLDLANIYPNGALDDKSIFSSVANLFCPLRPGYTRVGDGNFNLNNVVRNNDRVNVRGYYVDKDYLMTLDCRRLTYGVNAEPRRLIPPNSQVYHLYKKICLASRK